MEWLLACLGSHPASRAGFGLFPLQLGPFGGHLEQAHRNTFFPNDQGLHLLAESSLLCATLPLEFVPVLHHPNDVGGLGTCQASGVLTQNVLCGCPGARNF